MLLRLGAVELVRAALDTISAAPRLNISVAMAKNHADPFHGSAGPHLKSIPEMGIAILAALQERTREMDERNLKSS